MGVMNCSRVGCSNIMCDTYVDDVGYVCYECTSEFKKYLSFKNSTELTEREFHAEFKIFMKSRKDSFDNNDKINVDDFFEKYTR